MNNFTFSRTLKAPRDLVFDCWVKPERFGHWFSPASCESKLLYADVRPGGYCHQETHGDEGEVNWNKFEYLEINPIEKLVFVVSFCDRNLKPAEHPMFPEWPERLLTTVTFEDSGVDTKVTVLWEPLEASAEETAFFMSQIDACQIGWSETFDKIEKTVESLQPVS